ncbi:hypothetical protein AACH06_15040 [Ideonella sp. DXS29W]|uniref:Uncharacterized protein n=1 Tax=Ideonella lacteola TaxID=2984193 RepID=A0ABU9BQA1_9BURK
MLRNVVVNTAKVIGRAGVGYGLEKAAESAKEGIEGDKKPEGNAKPPGNSPDWSWVTRRVRLLTSCALAPASCRLEIR